jgi:hypothetical protein
MFTGRYVLPEMIRYPGVLCVWMPEDDFLKTNLY